MVTVAAAPAGVHWEQLVGAMTVGANQHVELIRRLLSGVVRQVGGSASGLTGETVYLCLLRLGQGLYTIWTADWNHGSNIPFVLCHSHTMLPSVMNVSP